VNRKFHLTHIVPNPKLHIYFGHREIIETVQWGLINLGHEVTYAVNQFRNDVVNIVFGAQALGIPALQALPQGTIVYNLEQIAGYEPEELRESLTYCAHNFTVWDYSEFNLPTWTAMNPKTPIVHVPIGYAPILSRIEKPADQDIEVLFYGGPGGNRLRIFYDLCQKLVRAVFVHGLYGASRDSLIARSKLVLNVNQHPRTNVFEMARVSYLLSNRKAVVSDFSYSTKIEYDLNDVIVLAATDRVVEECLQLLADDARRTKLEESGYEFMTKRDIRGFLSVAI
jgi:hypothetical protein